MREISTVWNTRPYRNTKQWDVTFTCGERKWITQKYAKDLLRNQKRQPQYIIVWKSCKFRYGFGEPVRLVKFKGFEDEPQEMYISQIQDLVE